MIKTILKYVSPPIIFNTPQRIKRWLEERNPNHLFDGDSNLFIEHANSCSVYGEYGCGKSTTWVGAQTNAQIYSVDTSREWVSKVRNQIRENSCQIKYIDVGEVGLYGRPVSYSHAENFLIYAEWIWQQESIPNLVLIDGRFRVLCFLYSLKLAPQGTKIIFDDYTHRGHYLVIERFLKPVEKHDRQALFVVPELEMIDIPAIDAMIEKFHYVMD